MKKYTYLLLMLALTSNCSQPIFANSKVKSSSNKQNVKQESVSLSLKRGKQFNSKNENYVFVPELVSAESNEVNMVKKIPDLKLASKVFERHSVLENDVVQQKGNVIIFNPSQSKLNQNLATQPVVYNERTKQYGILTGSIIIKYDDFQKAEALRSEFNLTESKRYKRLNRIIYKTEPSEKIVDIVSEIKAKYPNCDVNIEVIENYRIPQ